MSINDFLEADGSLTLILWIAFLSCLATILAPWANKRKERYMFGDNEKGIVSKEMNATIFSHRSIPSPANKNISINFVTFKLQNSQIIELAIEDISLYNDLLNGGCGTLCHQGKKFISFIRNQSNTNLS